MHHSHEITAIDSGRRSCLPASLLILCLISYCAGLQADQANPNAVSANRWSIHAWKVQTSLYTRHWHSDPAHDNHQELIGLEAVCANDWLFGAAFFDNSFSQHTQFVYVGKTWPLFGSNFWYGKLVGGLIHGYKKPYEHKIPLNGWGIAPAILPALGLKYKRVFLETNFAGTAAVTVTAGITF